MLVVVKEEEEEEKEEENGFIIGNNDLTNGNVENVILGSGAKPHQ